MTALDADSTSGPSQRRSRAPVAHGRPEEAELPPDVGRPVGEHETVVLRRAVVEDVRPDVVRLAQPAVVVVGVGLYVAASSIWMPGRSVF